MVVLVTIALAGGCAARDSVTETSYVARDSAGVRIIQSASPAWASGEEWTVGGEPGLQIGMLDGPDEYQFSAIAGVFQQANGRIVVGDFRSVIRMYDAEGSYLRSIGGEGDGPGEFRRLDRLEHYRGDSLLALDNRAGRVSIFDPEGNLARWVMIPRPPPPEPRGTGSQAYWTLGGISGAATDGSFLGASGTLIEGEPGQRVIARSEIALYSPEGDSLKSLGSFQAESEVTDFGRTPRLSGPYQRPFLWTARPGGMLVAQSAHFEIEDISFERGVERLIRATHLDLTLTDDHREEYRESERWRPRANVDSQALERALLEVVFPEVVPPTSQLLLDSLAHLWVRHYKLRGSAGPETWSVFSPDGFLLGTVVTPERLQVRQIGPDFLLGIWTDDLDVRYVRKYELVR